MTLNPSLILVFHLLLGLLISVSICTAYLSKISDVENGDNVYEAEKTEKKLNDWTCPDITEIPNISCTCDVPHTVRCSGQAANSSDLRVLSKELLRFSKATNYVSLLDLSIHGLNILEPSVFHGLTLMGLVISNAGLRELNGNPFGGLEADLAALGLPGNKLKMIPSAAIKGLFALRWFDLSDNDLKSLTTHEFPNLVLLENVNLSGNNISSIETEAFGHLPKLKILNLSWNTLDISQLNERTLWGLHSLRELYLKSNFLKGSLTPTFLSSVPSLVKLDLSHNYITKISLNALSNSNNLLELDLSYNKIEIIEDHSFKCLLKLQKLDLSHNNIVAISGWSFAHLKNLRSLSIADNSLFAVTADLLHQLKNLTSLDLSSNDITLLQPNVLNYTQFLTYIDLSENPLHCDCMMNWLLKWLKTHTNITKNAINSFVCTTPPKLENTMLIEVSEEDLVCSKTISDYYHDLAIEYDEEPHLYDAEVALNMATWTKNGVKLVWDIDRSAIPYTCQSMHIYEMKRVDGIMHQILTENMEISCTSGGKSGEQVSVNIPSSILEYGSTYRYCLVLIRHGNFEDSDSFLPGCSEPISYSKSFLESGLRKAPLVNSLTVGVRKSNIVVLTRIDYDSLPCFYRIFVLSDHKIINYTMLECPQNTFSFSNLAVGRYTVCAQITNNKFINRTILEWNFEKENLFSECTSVLLFAESDNYTAHFVTLFFTLFGFAFFITAYVIGRKVWKGGGIPWKWDPRAGKSAKYFLYTGETITPTVSLDNLPSYLHESTTRV